MRRALSSFVVCGVLLTTGCATGGSGDAGAGPAPVVTTRATPAATPTPTPGVAASQAVRDALAATGRTSARTAVRTELGRGSGPAYVLSGAGVHDFAGDRGSVSVGLADAVRFDEVFADGRVYVRGEAGGESMPWSYVDRADAKARHMLRAPANDPEYTLRQASMGERFQRIGEEKLRGAAVTRYRGLLPHRALTLEMGEETRVKADTLRTYFGGRIPVTVDVWVDGRERAVRVRLSMTVKDVMSAVTTLTLTELGRPVKVVVPAGATASDASVLG
ncbi:hypothetical protein [Streptomyces sp. NPDC057695]|uniref:hypothetical protein n=1 Tax=Streptomyces sp. NPDC057695 TaxID=3346217 RepID=UPI0036A31A2A